MDTMQTNSSTTDSKPTEVTAVRTKRRWGRILGCILVSIAAVVLFLFLNALFLPKYADSIYEGRLVAEYYTSEKEHDLMIIGDCEAYENISPVTLWNENGIPSYIRGSPQQLIWQSYYLLEDTLRYETPQTVAFSVLAMKYGTPQSEAYNRLTVDGMALSPTKIAAANASMTEEENLMSYIFPLFRYHDRWKELNLSDFEGVFRTKETSHNGFMMRCDVMPLGRIPTPQKLGDYTLDANAMLYLDKMRLLCEENGIKLVLFKAPTPYPHWYPEWDAQIAEYAEKHGLLYINALEDSDSIGIDWETDTYDAGLHLNLTGAEKFSRYLGKILQEKCGLANRSDDTALAEIWAKKTDAYQKMKQLQYDEIDTYGKIITLTKE